MLGVSLTSGEEVNAAGDSRRIRLRKPVLSFAPPEWQPSVSFVIGPKCGISLRSLAGIGMFMLCSETFKSAHVDLALLPTYRMPSEPFASSSAQEALGVSATALRRGRSAGRVRRLQRNFGKNEPIFGFGRTNPVAAQVDGAAFLHRGSLRRGSNRRAAEGDRRDRQREMPAWRGRAMGANRHAMSGRRIRRR